MVHIPVFNCDGVLYNLNVHLFTWTISTYCSCPGPKSGSRQSCYAEESSHPPERLPVVRCALTTPADKSTARTQYSDKKPIRRTHIHMGKFIKRPDFAVIMPLNPERMSHKSRSADCIGKRLPRERIHVSDRVGSFTWSGQVFAILQTYFQDCKALL